MPSRFAQFIFKMNKNEIASTLFRFVNVRNPQLPKAVTIPVRFVSQDLTLATGVFHTAVSTRATGVTKSQALATAAAGSFKTPILSDKELRVLSPQLFDFSEWVMQNRAAYTDAELKVEVAKVKETIANDKLQKLWDNLFYQVITQKDFYVKEGVMQMLTAYHIKNKLSATDPEFNKMLVNARIALPTDLFLDDEMQDPVVVEETGKYFPVLPNAARQQQLAVISAEIGAKNAAVLKKGLGRLETDYQKDYQEAYDAAYAQYNESIAPLLEQYQKDVEESRTKFCSVRDNSQPYDANDPCQQPPSVPFPTLPEFKFSYKPEIDATALESKLSYIDKVTLLQVMGYDFAVKDTQTGQAAVTLKNVTLPTAYKEINIEVDNFIEKSNQAILRNTVVSEPQLSIGGVIIPAASSAASLNPDNFVISPVKNGRTTLYNLEIGTQEQDVYKVVVTQKNKDNSTVVTTVDAPTVSRNGGTKTIDRLFSYTTPDGVPANAPTLEFDVHLSDGSVKKIPGLTTNQTSSARGKMTTVTAATAAKLPLNPVKTFSIPRFGLKQVGIADYLKVEQSVQCYVEGEVSHIENIMAREYKEKSSRRLTRTEDTTTSSSESESEKLTDTTTTDRFEMQSEVSKVIQDSKDLSATANAGYRNKTTGFYVDGSLGLASNTSKEESTRRAVTEAKEITSRALDRVVSKIKEERVRKVIEEFEENNKHGFDNRKGDNHVVGVYRWVDKLYKNQVVNYGKRLMYEFMIPEPARLHLLGMAGDKITQNSGTTTTNLIPPVDPRTGGGNMKIASYIEMADYKVAHWAGFYNVELEKKPEEYITVGSSFSIKWDGGAKLDRVEANSGSGKVTIPENYKATYATGRFNAVGDYDNVGGKLLSLNIGNVSGRYEQRLSSYSMEIYGPLTGAYSSEVPVSYTLGNHVAGDITVNVSCQLTAEASNEWKQRSFNAIIHAYEDALAEYNKKVSELVVIAEEKKRTNPGFYRQIENIILKKNCISYLVDKNSATNTYGKLMHNNNTSFLDYEVNPNQAFNNYASFVKFMEQAFEWDIMSYTFYPFYWAQKDAWREKYQFDESSDPVFRSFIQSGMARVMVTVRPGFEEAVQSFMTTGTIWNGGQVPLIGDKMFMSVVDELRQPAGELQGKAWLTRVPTSLTILQAGSAGLVVEKALPCDCENIHDFENPSDVPCSDSFKITEAQLGNEITTPQPVVERTSGVLGNIIGTEGKNIRIELRDMNNVIVDVTYTQGKSDWIMGPVVPGKYILVIDAGNVFAEAEYIFTEGMKETVEVLHEDEVLEVLHVIKHRQ